MDNPKRVGAPGHSAPAGWQGCTHRFTHFEKEPASGTHFGREVCSCCRAFRRWVPKPSTIEQQLVNAFRIAKLSMHPGLTDWERHLVRDVSKLRRLSPKQEALIARLCATYLEGKPS